MTALQDVALTNLGRVLWPRVGFTKGDLVAYYEGVVEALLPHIAGRALTLGRFPAGVNERGFAQTQCRGRPSWMATRTLRLRDGRLREYCVVDDRRSLLWVANQSAIELHPFLSREVHEEPTHVSFDLDPGPGTDPLDCCRVALRLCGVLSGEGLESFVKTSGFSGLHVQVPLNAPHSYAQTKAFARALAMRMASEDPDCITDRMRRSARTGRVLVDWTGNDASRSTVAPYSLRAGEFPTVSTPLAWEEVEAAREPADLWFEAGEVLRRVQSGGDTLAPALGLHQRLPD